MTARTSLLLLGLTALAAPCAAAATRTPLTSATLEDHGDWVADFDQAAAIAKKEGKALLVDFTGSDWCGWCIRLHKEVFDHEEFLTEAKKMFVLTALDFPRSPDIKAKVPNPERNEELKNKYGIQGFPTILILTSEGELLGQTGYQEGGPTAYIESLKKLYSEGKEAVAAIDKLVADYAAAAEGEKAAFVERALAQIEKIGAGNPLGARLMPMAHEAMKGSDEKLKRRAALIVLEADGIDATLLETAAQWDPRNEQGFLASLTKSALGSVRMREDLDPVLALIDQLDALGPIADTELATDVYFLAAYWNHNYMNDSAKAKIYAAKAKLLITDEERSAALQEILDA